MTMKRRLRRVVGASLRFAIRLLGPLFARGSKLSHAMKSSARYAALGRNSTIGYFNAESEAPRAVADASLAALAAMTGSGALAAANGRPYLSIKVPSLRFDPSLVAEIVDKAAVAGIGVHFDSHSPGEADETFRAIDGARERIAQLPSRAATPARDGGDPAAWELGCTLPGRWLRSRDDVERAVEGRLRVRVVKGQWADPSSGAIDPRQGFLAVIDRLAGRACQVAVASHDPPLAREALHRLRRAGTPCELELLLGLPMQGALKVAREVGAPVRIYIPFGVSWIPYALAYVQKNPHVAWWAIRDAAIGRYLTAPSLSAPEPGSK
jgi:proline dehydrogenase